MKVSEYSPVGKTGTVGRKKAVSSASGDDFLGLLSSSEVGNAAAPAATQDMQPVTSMNGLLSLQEMPDDEIKKRRAVQESRTTLEALETLRLALLSGSIPEHLLHTLSKVVAAQKERVNDPQLMRLIEDIELRAAVELAKLERASQKN